MKFCWLAADCRPTIEDVHSILKQLLVTKEQDDFEMRWNRLIPKEARVHRIEPVSRRVEVILHESEHRDINESEVSSGTGSITDPLEAHADMMPTDDKTPSKSHTSYQMTSTPLNHSGQTESFASAKTEFGSSRYVTAKSFPSNFEQNGNSIDETMVSELDSRSKNTKDSAYSDISNVNNNSTTPLFDVSLIAVDTGIHSDSSSTKVDEDKSLLLNKVTEVSIAMKNELIGNENDAVTTDEKDDVVILSNDNESLDSISPYDSFHSARRFPNRSLITIPEDEMVSDNSLREGYSVSTPFEIVFDESHMHDTFEWDYDIGEELVGRVKESENSVPQMSDLTDWTFEVGESSQGSTSSRSACDDDVASMDSQHSSLNGDVEAPIAHKSGSIDIKDVSIISDGTNALSSPNPLSDSQLSSVFDSEEVNARSSSTFSFSAVQRTPSWDMVSVRELTNRLATPRTNKSQSMFYKLSHSLDIEADQMLDSPFTDLSFASISNAFSSAKPLQTPIRSSMKGSLTQVIPR